MVRIKVYPATFYIREGCRNRSEQEESILDQAIEGDEAAFSILYQENVKKIYNYIYYRTGNVGDAEDLTARVFQRALKK